MTDSRNRRHGGSTSATGDDRSYRHEALLYDSEEGLLDVVVPFLEDGVAAGEPSLAVLGPAIAGLVRAALGEVGGVTFVGDGVRYGRPAAVMRSTREVLAAHMADGASRIRVVGDVPHPGLGVPWDGWARYEAAINRAYADIPLWGLCPYDIRITPDAVLDDVVRTHSHLISTDGHPRPNRRYQDPVEFLAHRPPGEADPLEAATPPLVDMIDPTPATARDAVRTVIAAGPTFDADDLVLAVSETVTNALTHGRRPARLRLWAATDRIVATVTDQGDGPGDPFVGLQPTARTSSAGLGLWLVHQICDHVTLDRTDDGFTVRLVVGTPHLRRA